MKIGIKKRQNPAATGKRWSSASLKRIDSSLAPPHGHRWSLSHRLITFIRHLPAHVRYLQVLNEFSVLNGMS